ncbi:MAG: hypothetical protein IH802_05125 [Nitrospinae bacterium]|nr:hypothetical protein [Nitrospinota bacterium]MCH7500403.1 hypothetical protein [Nitrospinota bacterium]MCH8932595.1 hypothetical protein [Nitrospinota bacterium]
MENHSKYILKVRNVSVYTNLEVILKSKTTNEEACKEVTRMIEDDDLFEGYEWKIEGCADGGINDFNARLQADILERLEQEEPEDHVFWNGSKIQFELNVAHIPVKTNLEVPLKSNTKEEALKEIDAMCNGGNLFEGYEWKIEGCADGGINEFSDELKEEIVHRLGQEQKIEDCIEVHPAP